MIASYFWCYCTTAQTRDLQRFLSHFYSFGNDVAQKFMHPTHTSLIKLVLFSTFACETDFAAVTLFYNAALLSLTILV